MAVIRISRVCNGRCVFCGVDTQDPCRQCHPTRAEVADLLVRFPPKSQVELSGGEPTLHPQLEEIIRLAAHRRRLVILQTNAMLIDRAKARALQAAGLRKAFVSLHAPDAELSDAITRTPGGFGRTLAGIGHLLDAGLLVNLNCVVHAGNVRRLADYVEFIFARFGRRTPITFSMMAPTFRAWDTPGLLFRFTDHRPDLTRAFDRCLALGIKFDVPQICGLPPCLVPGYESFVALSTPEVEGVDPAGEITKRKAAGCRECVFDRHCTGLWSRYVERYGLGELTPIRPLTRQARRLHSLARGLFTGHMVKTFPQQVRESLITQPEWVRRGVGRVIGMIRGGRAR